MKIYIMRYMLLSVLFYLTGIGFLKSQTKIITINFKSKALPTVINVSDIKKGDFYQIQIDNINLNLFKVSLTTTDTVLTKPLQTPTFGNLFSSFSIDDVSKLITGLVNFTTSASDSSGGLSPQIKIKPLDRSAAALLKSLQDRMNEEQNRLELNEITAQAIRKKFDDLKMYLLKIRYKSYLLENETSGFDIDNTLIDIEAIRIPLAALMASVAENKLSYQIFSQENEEAIAKDKKLTAKDKLISDIYKKFFDDLSKAQETVSADSVNNLLSSTAAIQNNRANTYLSLPQQFFGEQSKVELSIVQRDEKTNLQNYSTQIMFPIKFRHYVTIGLSLYCSSLKGDAYSLQNTSPNYKLVEENVNEAEIGFTTLMRFGTKFWKGDFVGAHFSIGPGVSLTDKVRPRLLFGGGLSFGNMHMFALDFGGIAGYINRLSRAYDISSTYKDKPENVTVSYMKVGGLFP